MISVTLSSIEIAKVATLQPILQLVVLEYLNQDRDNDHKHDQHDTYASSKASAEQRTSPS